MRNDEAGNTNILHSGMHLILIFFLIPAMLSCRPVENEPEPSPYLEAVQAYADHVLEHGRDRYGPEHTPLFADGIDVETKEPMLWKLNGETQVLSNFGSQQTLMRVLTGLTEITGEGHYREAAEEAVRYMFEHQTDSQGLFYWGGHQFIDLVTLSHPYEGRPHELKNNFPYYELMWETDPAATRAMLRAMWNAHILDWEVLDLNRHGSYDLEMGPLWDHEFNQPEPFFEGRGLTFINAGADMIQSAMALYALGSEEDARIWGLRLYDQYVRARHPDTGLGAYQYSRPLRRDEPPAEGPLTGTLTFSGYGDRAENQFGRVYGDIAREGNVLWGGRVSRIYGRSSVMFLHLAEQLEGTEAGDRMMKQTLDGLKALAEYAYVPEENHFKPMWTDGTDLTGHEIPRTGYYGREGNTINPSEPDGPIMLSYAKGVRLSGGDPALWNVIRHIFKGFDLGDPGAGTDAAPSLNLETPESDPTVLVAVLELYRASGREEYLDLAQRIGDNILQNHYHDGYFIPTRNHIYTRFDDPAPHALLMLEAAISGRPESVPPFLTGIGVTDGDYEGRGRMRDHTLYEATR